MMSSKCLVTGGAGFIGSHIVRALLEEGSDVRVIDNLVTGKRGNLKEVEREIEFMEGDIRNPVDCSKACQDVEVAYHLAALGSVPRSVEDPFTSNDVNVTGTLNILIAARDERVRRVVFSSSSSVYGNTPSQRKHEGMKPNPLSPYAASKLAGEAYCSVFNRNYDIETVVLRYFNVFGPRQDPNSQYAAVIPRFISALERGESPVIYGDGEQTRDFTYVQNVVNANLLASKSRAAIGHVMNIACGDEISVNRLLSGIARRMQCTANPVHFPERAGDIKHSCADIQIAREILNYEPSVTFEIGLDKTVESFRNVAARK
jgi:nucleoside-diphosphate-sugar epimerase